MKTTAIVMTLFLLSVIGLAQSASFEYAGRRNPSVKKEKLNAVNSISDIVPDVWYRLGLPYKVREELEHRRKMDELGCFIFYPQGYNYNRLIEYVAVEIAVKSNDKVVTSQSTSDKLTIEQKAILSTADSDSDIRIKIKFRYKNGIAGNKPDDKVLAGGLIVTVVPATEAEYPGGFKQLTAYLTENIISAIKDKSASDKLQQATVKFTVNEQGRAENIKVMRVAADPETDKLVLDAIKKMPSWKPAKDANGNAIEQKISIPFGADGC